MTVNEYMADFFLAGTDYERLNEAVHEYLDNYDRLDVASKNECISRISDCIASCKESIDRAKGSAHGALNTDIPNDQVYEDVVASFGMVRSWENSVSMLISIMRSIALETDTDCIDLLARARDNAHATNTHRAERTLDIAEGIELFSEYPEEDESEDGDCADDAIYEESEGEDADGIEDDDSESDDSASDETEVVGGWMPSDIPTNGPIESEAESVDDGSSEIFVVQTAETADAGSPVSVAPVAEPTVEVAPTEKPLTRDEIQSIVLETMKEFFAQSATAAPPTAQEEKKSKKTTRRKSNAVKSVRTAIRRKKADDSEESAEEEE